MQCSIPPVMLLDLMHQFRSNSTHVLTKSIIYEVVINPLAGRATFLSPTVHGRSDNIVVFP